MHVQRAGLVARNGREVTDARVDEVLGIEEHTRRLRLYGGGYTAHAERRRTRSRCSTR